MSIFQKENRLAWEQFLQQAALRGGELLRAERMGVAGTGITDLVEVNGVWMTPEDARK